MDVRIIEGFFMLKIISCHRDIVSGIEFALECDGCKLESFPFSSLLVLFSWGLCGIAPVTTFIGRAE